VGAGVGVKFYTRLGLGAGAGAVQGCGGGGGKTRPRPAPLPCLLNLYPYMYIYFSKIAVLGTDTAIPYVSAPRQHVFSHVSHVVMILTNYPTLFLSSFFFFMAQPTIKLGRKKKRVKHKKLERIKIHIM
jgi:hypothetical protein